MPELNNYFISVFMRETKGHIFKTGINFPGAVSETIKKLYGLTLEDSLKIRIQK